MKYYLSSMYCGDHVSVLVDMLGVDACVGFIINAGDYRSEEFSNRSNRSFNRKGMAELAELGLVVEKLDLRLYFHQTDRLRKKLESLDGVFVRGGNTFVLLQSMKLSGLTALFPELQQRDDFVYAGYSAGVCCLSPSMRGIAQVDDPTALPYELKETVWDGLNVLDVMALPHYRSAHSESADIEKWRIQ